MESLYLTTSDNVKIAANHFPVDRKKYPSPKGWVIFLHMMPATKESWGMLAEQLQQAGHAGLAIDLRGHGASEGGPNGFTRFHDVDHQSSMRDVDAAVDFLKKIGARDERICLIGASIGANLALHHVGHHRQSKKAVLLSPGFDYRGILTRQIVETLPADKKLFFIAARDDDNGENASEAEALYAASRCEEKQKELFETGGHGTAILDAHPELIEEILTFINNHD